jgi:hypothetical protein
MVSETECATVYSYTFWVEDVCGNEAEETVLVTKEINKYENCETAYAKLEEGARCFLDDGFNRWGWTNKISPSEEPYMLPLYAGAAQCDPSKGMLVGTVKVTYYNGSVSVEYIMDEGYVMSEAHVYVGCQPYPELKKGKTTEKTVAPGQYTFVNGDLMYSSGITVNFENVTGDVYVIAHAVTCEEVCRCSEFESVDDGKVFDPVNLTIDCSQVIVAQNPSPKIKSLVPARELKAYPNPFSNKVTFEFVSAKDARARLEITNLAGQRIAVLMDQMIKKGVMNRIEYTPVDVVSGVLIYRLILDDNISTGRLIYRVD